MMKVNDAVARIERINVILDIFEIRDMNAFDESAIEDIGNLLSEYKDELLNKDLK